MEEKDLYEQLVAQTVQEAIDIGLKGACANATGDDPKKSKANPILVANELVKTRNEQAIEEAKIQTENRKLDLEEKRLEAEKLDKANELVKNVGGCAVGAGGLVVFWKAFTTLIKFEEAGHMITSQAGRTILSCLKIFKR